MEPISSDFQVASAHVLERILPCSKTPATAAESAVHLLQARSMPSYLHRSVRTQQCLATLVRERLQSLRVGRHFKRSRETTQPQRFFASRVVTQTSETGLPAYQGARMRRGGRGGSVGESRLLPLSPGRRRRKKKSRSCDARCWSVVALGPGRGHLK